jgi:signal transduction histidine kinase
MSKLIQAEGKSQQPTPDVGLLFLSNFVHQVVNPMNGIIGTLSNITDGTYPENVVKQKVNASRAQLEQCVSLIRNLAYISDYFFEESDKAALRPVKKDGGTSILPQVIIESIQFYQVIAEKKRIALELLDATKYRVKIRPELLKQVFINQFDNWTKYGQPGQKITVDVKVNQGQDLVVSITGKSVVGFDGNDAESIFTLGYRSKEAKGLVAQGSGIGLYVCRAIMINEIGGNIRAEHHKQTATSIFTTTIPRGKWEL